MSEPFDPFATLGAPRRFALQLPAVEKTHRELSRALHPDRFAQATASERRAALERAANVNEAWRIVRDPIRRAEALFALHRVEVGETREPKSSPAFLMEMMEEREALSDARAARDLARVHEIRDRIVRKRDEAEGELASAFGEDAPARGVLDRVLPRLGELRFYRRLLDEVDVIEEESVEALR